MKSSRREFFKGTACMGLAAMAAGCSSNPFKFFGTCGAPMQGFALPPMKKLRGGFGGVKRDKEVDEVARQEGFIS